MQDDYSVVQDVESQIRRISIQYPGHVLDMEDVTLVRDVLLLQYGLILDLLPHSLIAGRRWRSFLGMGVIDVIRYSATLKYADDYVKNLTRSKADQRSLWDFQTFKQSVKDAGLYWGLLSPIEEPLRDFLEKGSVDAFAVINTWVNFPQRANLRSLDLGPQMEDEYIEFESQMATWSYPADLIQSLNAIMREWMDDFTMDEFIPRNGPGSVAEIERVAPTLVGKYLSMRTDLRVEYFYSHELGYRIEDDFPLPLQKGLLRRSTLICVPKGLTKNRTISKEPCILQYLQQGILRCLTLYFEQCPEIRKHIALEQQPLSRSLARVGSYAGEFGTIDLSNASDSVSYSLVKSLFRGTRLLPALICTRSESTRLPSGRSLVLNKFAPMGSAVCFPIECLVFACVCEYVCRKLGHRGYYRIYGDDIVASEDLCQGIIETLTQLHFSVNAAKTFIGGGSLAFREACGGEYLAGRPVDPFRVSRWWRSGTEVGTKLTVLSADNVASYVAFANKAFDRGLMTTRRQILYLLRQRCPYYDGLVFREDDSHLRTYADGYTNWKLKSRFLVKTISCPCFHRREVRGWEPSTRIDQRRRLRSYSYHLSCLQEQFLDEIEDRVRHFEFWQHLKRHEDPVIELNVRFAPEPRIVSPTSSVMRWKWVCD